MEVVVDDGEAPERLSDLVEDAKRRELVVFIREIAARICRAIRYYGYVLAIPDVPRQRILDVDDANADLHWWGTEVSSDGSEWDKVIPTRSSPSLLSAILSLKHPVGFGFVGSPQIPMSTWPDVVEALEDHRDPPAAEQEFVMNATDHLQGKNYRLAVIESVIGLEIVLTEYLTNYLKVFSHLRKARIKKFLSPEIGLTARLSALLNLTLHQSYLDKIEFDKVFAVVGWRNGIVHKTGRLPEWPSNETLHDNIVAVLNLVGMLAERRTNIAAEPELEPIRRSILDPGDIMSPSIWLKGGHRVRMDVKILDTADPTALEEKMRTVAAKAGDLFHARDLRFDAAKHLIIHFSDIFDKSLGWFGKGTLTLPTEPASTGESGQTGGAPSSG